MPTNYERGRRFEYRVRDALMKRGAVYVMRAASSKGAADLIALFPDLGEHIPHVWLVQVKYSVNGGGYLPPAERADLIDIAERTGARPVYARPGKNGRGVEFKFLNEE